MELNDALGAKIIDMETLKRIQDRVKFLTENPPNMICVNVVLSGSSALKHMVARDIIVLASGVTEQEADWYLLCAGSERELSRLATIGVAETNEVQ